MGDLARFVTPLKKPVVSPVDLHNFAREVDKHISRIVAIVSVPAPGRFVDNPNQVVESSLHYTSAAVPSPAALSVVGIDGKFIVQIANPQAVIPQSVGIAQARVLSGTNPYNKSILHNLESSTDLTFSNASTISDYGTSPTTSYEFQNPNATLFWRLRSSYDGTNWNAWQIYSSVQTCGPLGVQSGAARAVSIAPNAQFSETNFATLDSIDNGTNATIRVYGPGGVGTSWTRVAGALVVGSNNNVGSVFPAASLVGYPYATILDVFYDIATQQYFVVNPATNFPGTLVDTYAFAGQLTTVSAGGGGGSSGGGGGGGGNGGGSGQRK